MDQDPIEINSRAYNLIAAQFAVMNAKMPDSMAERAERLLAKIRPGGRILDLGCGPGRDLAWFEAKGARVTGADLSTGMLKEARKAAQSCVCQMEMRKLGFADGSFAAVWCNAALLHIPKKENLAALNEIFRVLIPSGLFFFSLQEGHGEGIETSPLADVQRFFARYEMPEMMDLLAQAGFHLDCQERLTVDLRTRLTWLWFEAMRS